MLTRGMGGLLPEQPEPTNLKHILDVGCGTGNWLIETANTFPGITRLIGVDVSSTIVAYARKQAEDQQISDRVAFAEMDALRLLEFPEKYFDLVNQRLG